MWELTQWCKNSKTKKFWEIYNGILFNGTIWSVFDFKKCFSTFESDRIEEEIQWKDFVKCGLWKNSNPIALIFFWFKHDFEFYATSTCWLNLQCHLLSEIGLQQVPIRSIGNLWRLKSYSTHCYSNRNIVDQQCSIMLFRNTLRNSSCQWTHPSPSPISQDPNQYSQPILGQCHRVIMRVLSDGKVIVSFQSFHLYTHTEHYWNKNCPKLGQTITTDISNFTFVNIKE